MKNLGISTLPDETLPQMATAGIAWSPLRPWTIACDFNYPFSFPGQPPAEVWNIAVGTTVAVTSFLSVQGGVLMKADNPRISVGAALALGTLALDMNYNLDLSGSLNPAGQVQRPGEVRPRETLAAVPAPRKPSRCTCRASRSSPTATTRRPSTLWQEVLKLDPKYLPAADNIRTVQRDHRPAGTDADGQAEVDRT